MERFYPCFTLEQKPGICQHNNRLCLMALPLLFDNLVWLFSKILPW
jgi:hypothetical protein